ncbi:hypothetical protein QQS21_009682 [Conoideocrella luteorostrata]|uniref:Uncharacterized protein n=1 Tax=Conoideocrella luteorostrata TaxID=1105319 RepID=A0AAJ0FQ54_9HYPO|nr:hypothetical protein QQS21_009682 [Conoideocrella luteorostrata]
MMTLLPKATKQAREERPTEATRSPTRAFESSSALTIIGPLTTFFTPAGNCQSLVADDPNRTDDVFLQYGLIYDNITNNPGIFRRPDDCFPKGYMDLGLNGKNGIFSPGDACPLGYGSSCVMVPGGAPVSAAKTVVVGYACDQDQPYSCFSVPDPSEEVTYVVLIHDESTQILYQQTMKHPLTKVRVAAPRVIYALDNTATLPPLPTSSLTAEPSSSSSTNNTGAPDTNSPNSSSLIAGLAVGVAFVILIPCVVAFVYWRRRKSKAAAAALQTPQDGTGNSQKKDESTAAVRSELYDTGMFEMPAGEGGIAGQEAAELPGSAVARGSLRAELQGEGHSGIEDNTKKHETSHAQDVDVQEDNGTAVGKEEVEDERRAGENSNAGESSHARRGKDGDVEEEK